MPLGPDFDSMLQAARVGAEWAWAGIYRDLAPIVLRYLRAQGSAEPEDLLGEVFVSVVRKLPTFQGEEPEFRAWVFTIARNALIDAWRRDGRRPVDYVADPLLLDARQVLSAEDDAMRRLAHERVSATLGRLSPHQREVVFLRVIAGLSIDECARVLGKRPGAVKSLQARGLAAIRREILRGAVSS